jgi:predicted TIM-barrel fold metal-dependent hydrolase
MLNSYFHLIDKEWPMVIDSHLHVLKENNFDAVTEKALGHTHPTDTPIESLVSWLRDAGVGKAVVMGQDMSRIWNSACGEDYVLQCTQDYPDLFVGLASLEPVDKWGRYNRQALKYFKKAVRDYGFKGVLLTPPYGQYASDYWVAGSGVFSDHPGDDMKAWIELIRNGMNQIAKRSGWPLFTQDEIDGILYKNAARLYGFDIAP